MSDVMSKMESTLALLVEVCKDELEHIHTWNKSVPAEREKWTKESRLPYPVRVPVPPSLIAAVHKFMYDNGVVATPATVDEIDKLREQLKASQAARTQAGSKAVGLAKGLEDLH